MLTMVIADVDRASGPGRLTTCRDDDVTAPSDINTIENRCILLCRHVCLSGGNERVLWKNG